MVRSKQTGALLIFVFLLVCGVQPLWAHQLYLEPEGHVAEPREPLTIWVYDGSFDRSTWPVQANQIVRLELQGPHGRVPVDRSTWALAKAGSRLWRARQDLAGWLGGRNIRYSSRFQAVPGEEGTHMIGLQIIPGRIAMEREGYLHYLEKEAFSSFALDDVAGMRGRTIIREEYRKTAKTIIQAGAALTDNVLEPIGLPAEIVPLEHPGRVRVGDVMRFRVLLHGAPLAGQNILTGPRAGPFKDSEESGRVVTTDEAGILTLPITQSGTWWLKFIHLRPVAENNDNRSVDFVSDWGSLTFEVN